MVSRAGTTDPLVGDVLDGRYEVLQRLARGGMATVYRAWDRRLERIVAIKVMHEGLGDDADFAAKFDREARAAARLCDQSVVSIFDQGYDHGRPYIVMEFVEGSTLRTLITRDAPLSPLRALQIIEPVAAALAVAHDSGLVHRDVKPENVLISDRGAIKVADFGLARTMTAQTAAHTQGLLIGTVSYLPPELLTSGRASSSSDVYSTGIMLFEMLTGSKPYAGDTPITVAYKHVNENVPLPSEVLTRNHPVQARRDPIPDYVDALVAACTRRNPQARPVDGRELLRRVRRVRRALERGIRSDDALARLVFPGAGLPWDIEQTQVIHQDAAPTSVLAHSEVTALPGQTASPADPPTPIEPLPAVRVPVVRAAPQLPVAAEPPPVSRRVVRGQAYNDSPGSRPPNRPTAPAQPVGARYPRLSQSHTHKRRQTALVTVLVLLLALAVGLGSWWFTSGRYVTTPSVINHTRQEATAIAQANGMTIIFTEEYSETVPGELVMSSSPGPGERVIRSTTLTAVVSKGPERFSVPPLVGLTLEEAGAALGAVNLQPGTVTRVWSESVAEGYVVEAGYPEGEQLKGGSQVDLVVSQGREPLPIPAVVGLSLADARTMLTEAGFEVATGEEQYDPKVPKGSVVSQEPANGTGHRGDTVSLVISKGVELVKVPDVKNMTQSEATKALKDAGFEIGEVVRTTPFQITVKSTDPAAGAEAPRGSKVALVMG